MNTGLNYPGSSWMNAKRLVSLLPKHHMYVEPYFGSGAVLFNKSVSNIEVINDINSDVTNLFDCIRNQSEELARTISMTPYSRNVYNEAFEFLEADNLKRAAQFLIRCQQGMGFSVCRKTGWKIDAGGRESMYALWNWYQLPEWILEAAERLKKVQIENKPAELIIRKFDSKDTVMYLDPPFLPDTKRQSKQKQYPDEMTQLDHERLLEQIVSSRSQIIICGYDNEVYNRTLATWNTKEFSTKVGNGLRRMEKIWYNFRNNEQITIYDFIAEE